MGPLGLVCWFVANSDWMEQQKNRRVELILAWKSRKKALETVPVEEQPNEGLLKAWLTLDGAAAAFYQIQQSGVPLLRGDVAAFKEALQATRLRAKKLEKDPGEAKARQERLEKEQAWQSMFQSLVQAHAEPQTGSHVSA